MADDANLKILKRRYAKGEITKAEYDQIRADLGGVNRKQKIVTKTSTPAPNIHSSTQNSIMGVDINKIAIAIVVGTIITAILSFKISSLSLLFGGIAAGLILGKGIKMGFGVGFVVGIVGGIVIVLLTGGSLLFILDNAIGAIVIALLGGVGGVVGQYFSKFIKLQQKKSA